MARNVKRPYRAPIRQEHARLTRERVVAAARDLFRERGYAGTSMDAVAEAAGVALQTVYAAVGSKRALASAVIEAAALAPGVPDLLERVVDEPDPRRKLEMAAQITRRILERGGEAVELMRRAGSDELLEEWRGWEQRRFRGQAALVRSLLATGVTRPDAAPGEVADLLWTLTGRDVYALLVEQRGWSPARYERWLAKALVRELLAPDLHRSPSPGRDV
jgi:AcrR family transcriptional regulator